MSVHFVLSLRDPPTAISDFMAAFTRETRDGNEELRERSAEAFVGAGKGLTL